MLPLRSKRQVELSAQDFEALLLMKAWGIWIRYPAAPCPLRPQAEVEPEEECSPDELDEESL